MDKTINFSTLKLKSIHNNQVFKKTEICLLEKPYYSMNELFDCDSSLLRT